VIGSSAVAYDDERVVVDEARGRPGGTGVGGVRDADLSAPAREIRPDDVCPIPERALFASTARLAGTPRAFAWLYPLFTSATIRAGSNVRPPSRERSTWSALRLVGFPVAVFCPPSLA
jgi:hypothetical protein